MLQYILATNSIDLIAGGLKYDLSKVSQKNFKTYQQTFDGSIFH